jgi:hypothetical protein
MRSRGIEVLYHQELLVDALNTVPVPGSTRSSGPRSDTSQTSDSPSAQMRSAPRPPPCRALLAAISCTAGTRSAAGPDRAWLVRRARRPVPRPRRRPPALKGRQGVQGKSPALCAEF